MVLSRYINYYLKHKSDNTHYSLFIIILLSDIYILLSL